MKIEVLSLGPYAANCVLITGDNGETAVVDPGGDFRLLEMEIKSRALFVRAYWITHGHLDHISALGEALAKHPAPVYMHGADAEWAFTDLNSFEPYGHPPQKPEDLRGISDGDVLSVSGASARVMHVPGHTPGGVAFVLDTEKGQMLLTGDTLFRGSVGRTDLPGGDWEQLKGSLARIVELSDSVRVIPGHGPETSLGHERATNPFLADFRDPE